MEKYAYSIKTTRVREPDFPYNGEKIDCTDKTVSFLRHLQSADNEKLIAIYLNPQNKIIGISISEGIVNQAPAYPREIVRKGLLLNATAIILAHNHPSGEPMPSAADIDMTKKVRDAAKLLDMVLHDHIVIAGDTGKFLSIREEGMMNFA